jgi:hypothetical protein
VPRQPLALRLSSRHGAAFSSDLPRLSGRTRVLPALRALAEAGRSLQLLHLPPALSGRRGHSVLRKRLLRVRLMLIKLVCLNLNRCDTWQQPDPAYRPASRADKNQKDISVHTLFNNVCTFHEMYTAICTQNINYKNLACTGLYMVCTCLYKLKHVYSCINMYIQV